MKSPKQNQMNAFYGNPDKNRDGQADRDWAAANLIKIVPPYPMWYPNEVVDPTTKRKSLVKRATQWKALTVHRLCADAMQDALRQIGATFSPTEMTKYELDICGGVYN